MLIDGCRGRSRFTTWLRVLCFVWSVNQTGGEARRASDANRSLRAWDHPTAARSAKPLSGQAPSSSVNHAMTSWRMLLTQAFSVSGSLINCRRLAKVMRLFVTRPVSPSEAPRFTLKRADDDKAYDFPKCNEIMPASCDDLFCNTLALVVFIAPHFAVGYNNPIAQACVSKQAPYIRRYHHPLTDLSTGDDSFLRH